MVLFRTTEVSIDVKSFSKGRSDAASLFCGLRDFSWTDTSHSIYYVASGLESRTIPHFIPIAVATRLVPVSPESSSTTKEILSLQKRPSLRKKAVINRLKVVVNRPSQETCNFYAKYINKNKTSQQRFLGSYVELKVL